MDDAAQHLVVAVAAGTCRIRLSEVVEIVRTRAITRVPNSPASVLGVANFRGAPLPVLSLARMLGRPGAAVTDSTRIVVVAAGGRAGLLVDGVAAISDNLEHECLHTQALLERACDAKGRGSRPSRVAASSLPHQPAERESDDRVALLTFEVSGQDFALPLRDVAAVIRAPSNIAIVPKSDDAIVGVTEHRARLLPLVSLAHLLGLSESDGLGEPATVLIVNLAGMPVGLVVGGTGLVVRVKPNTLDPVPSVLTRGRGEASLSAICRLSQGRLVSVLATDQLFDAETVSRLQSAHSTGEAMEHTLIATEAREQFVVFELGEERYGLPISAVDEVVRRPAQLTRVPGAPVFVEGIMNLRGKMIPVIDQRRRFGAAGHGRNASRIVVLTVDGLQTGIAVDRADEILSVAATEVKSSPGYVSGEAVVDRVVMTNASGAMVLLIEPRALLDQVERDLITAMQSKA